MYFLTWRVGLKPCQLNVVELRDKGANQYQTQPGKTAAFWAALCVT